MDKFDIHKWQRDAYTTLNEDTSTLTPGTQKVLEQIVGIYSRHVKKLPMNSDDDINLKRALCEAFDYEYFCNEDKSKVTTEAAGTNTNFDVEELNDALKSHFDSKIKVLVQQAGEGELRALVNKIESQTGIDIPDNESEVRQISNQDILILGKTLEDLNTTSEDKEFKRPTAADIVGTLGLIATAAGAASNVTVPGTGIPSAITGILLMRLAIYLDSKNQDDN